MEKKTALLLIDIQMDYFEGGAFPLDPTQRETALRSAASLLECARANGAPAIHVRHQGENPAFLRQGTPGAEIHPSVRPTATEIVVDKRYPNSFKDTGLEEILRARGIERLVVGGMIAWMCIQSTVRAAAELGFEVHLVPDMVASGGFAWRGTELDARTTLAASLFPLFFRFAKDTGLDEARRILGQSA